MFLGAVEAAEMNSFEIYKAISLSLNTPLQSKGVLKF